MNKAPIICAFLYIRLKETWLKLPTSHGILAVLLSMVTVYNVKADDVPEETWGTPTQQSAVSLNLSRTGNEAVADGAEVQISLCPTLYTWDVFTSNLGNISVGNVYSYALNQGSMTWVVNSGGGSFSSAPSDWSQGTTGHFIMGRGDADITVRFDSGYGSVSESLHIAGQSVSWSYVRTEGTLSVTLNSSAGTTLAPNASTTLSVHADYLTWDLYQSSDGQTVQQNYLTSPACGGTVSFSTSYGDVGGSSPLLLDASGNLTTSFTMGAESSANVAADVSYCQANNGHATLEFSGAAVEQGWRFDHNEATVYLQPSGTSSLNVAVTYSGWEAWTDGQHWDYRNPSSGPAVGATIAFGQQSGDGTYLWADTVTDYNGNAHAAFTGGAFDAVLTMNVSYATSSAFATWFVPSHSTTIDDGTNNGTGDSGDGSNGGTGSTGDSSNGDTGNSGDGSNGDTGSTGNGGSSDTGNGSTDSGQDFWRMIGTDGSISALVTNNSLAVTYNSWEIWTNDASGGRETRNYFSGPATGASIRWSITSGDATASGTNIAPGIYDSTATANITYYGYSTSTSVFVGGTGQTHTSEDQGQDNSQNNDNQDNNSQNNNTGNSTSTGGLYNGFERDIETSELIQTIRYEVVVDSSDGDWTEIGTSSVPGPFHTKLVTHTLMRIPTVTHEWITIENYQFTVRGSSTVYFGPIGPPILGAVHTDQLTPAFSFFLTIESSSDSTDDSGE